MAIEEAVIRYGATIVGLIGLVGVISSLSIKLGLLAIWVVMLTGGGAIAIPMWMRRFDGVGPGK